MKNIDLTARLLGFGASICLLASHHSALAETPVPAVQVVKPGPEHKKMGIFAGTWTYEGETFATPLGPKEKFKGKLVSRFILDGFALETKWEEKNPLGLAQGIEIHTYDLASKSHRTYMFMNDGSQMIGTDTFGDKGIGFSYRLTDGKGRLMLARATATFTVDHKQFTSKWELSADEGSSWMPFMEYTGKKAGK
ncbi:MAG: DUF1579 family protein [Verrucomicrobia bacterium]|nr:DUF1579 family protein [Verrucomicrobiota bacterium]MBI3866925.1 DUF1579 family protein [Verrucomicrobiota bacterium]